MRFVNRNELAILNVADNIKEIPYSRIRELMMEKETDVVYYLCFGKVMGRTNIYDLVGGDKEKLEFISINQNFETQETANYFRAQEFFSVNKNVRNLAVVNSNGGLLGEYRKTDDRHLFATKISFIKQLKRNKEYVKNNFKNEIYIRPISKEKGIFFDNMLESINTENFRVKVLDAKDVAGEIGKNSSSTFVVADWDEYNLIRAVYRHPMHACFVTWQSKIELWEKVYSDSVDGHLLKNIIDKQGLSVYTFNRIRRNTNWGKDFYGKHREYHVTLEAEREFFSEKYSKEYADEHRKFNWPHRRINGVNALKDIETPLVNVRHGERYVCYVPKTYERTIWFFGACTAVGAFVEDKYTIESILQKKLNDEGISCRVRNCGAWGGITGRLLETKFQEGDILILFSMDDDYSEYFPTFYLEDVAQEKNMPFSWFTDSVSHCNWKANYVWVEELWKLIEEDVRNPQEKGTRESFYFDKKTFLNAFYFDRYFHNYNPSLYNSVGSIVMNCNPFTLGHRYLIEECSKQVDKLFIFVVEEDKSVFRFTERYTMIVEGTKDLKNVTVIPGGAFILSQTTFPEYFIKIKDEDIVDNTQFDIETFAEYIAKPLGITHRFVGEEKSDEVTAEYNKAMHRILPSFGINVVELPRKEEKAAAISASRVRRLLQEDSLQEVIELLPESTRNFLGLSSLDALPKDRCQKEERHKMTMRGRNYVIITGSIRSELYLRILLTRLCDLRHRGIIEKIIFSTWDDEIDKFNGLREDLQSLSINIIETPYVDEKAEVKFNKLGLAIQATTIRNAVKKVPNDCFIFKLRTDYNIYSKLLFDFLLYDNKQFVEINRFGNFPIAFNNKIVIKIWGWNQLLFVCDRFYYASKEDLMKICLPIQNEKCRDVQMQVDNELILSYTYHFYPLLRDIWDVIPLNFYDTLHAYCRKIKDDELNLPVMLYRIYATMCVFIYTQVYLLDGNPQEDDSLIRLVELFSSKVVSNRSVEKVVKGYLAESKAAAVFKDELRKIALNLPEVHTYTFEEYKELQSFAKEKLHINLREYPYLMIDEKRGSANKKQSGDILLKKYSDNNINDRIIDRIDDDLDSFAVFYKENNKYLDEYGTFYEQLLRMGVYESDTLCIEKYLNALVLDKLNFVGTIWTSCLRYVAIQNNHSINEYKILSTYYVLSYYRDKCYINKFINDEKWRIIQALQRLMQNLFPNEKYRGELLSPEEYIEYLVRYLDNKNTLSAICLSVIEALLTIHPRNNPFSEVLLNKLRKAKKNEIINKILREYSTKFKKNDWYVSDDLRTMIANRNTTSIIEYACSADGAKEIHVILKYLWFAYWQDESLRLNISATIGSLSDKLPDSDFIIKAHSFLKTGELSVSVNEMNNKENFLILLEMLYHKGLLKYNGNKVSEMCFNDREREMFYKAFVRLETDDRLSFFSMKNGCEIWFHYVPYLQHKSGKVLVVPNLSNGRIWPGADRDNESAFAAYMRLVGNDIFVSIELCSKNEAMCRKLAKAVGYEEKNSHGSLIRLETKRIPITNEKNLYQAVNEAFDLFCKLGDRMVEALKQSL